LKDATSAALLGGSKYFSGLDAQFLIMFLALVFVTEGSALADDDIDWATALRAYYTAEVVYERCGFSASWEQLSALSESIDDAEREAGLPSSEQVSMRQEIEDDALSDEQAFCEENGRRLMLPDIPE
jgi:hypothetical protein